MRAVPLLGDVAHAANNRRFREPAPLAQVWATSIVYTQGGRLSMPIAQAANRRLSVAPLPSQAQISQALGQLPPPSAALFFAPYYRLSAPL
ncbi:hypothetical protein MRX96_021444 [Rhipicephalus microplus]